MASLILILVAKDNDIGLGSHTKYKMLYMILLNYQPLLLDILMRRSLDMMII